MLRMGASMDNPSWRGDDNDNNDHDLEHNPSGLETIMSARSGARGGEGDVTPITQQPSEQDQDQLSEQARWDRFEQMLTPYKARQLSAMDLDPERLQVEKFKLAILNLSYAISR
jgi:hypothetical protein